MEIKGYIMIKGNIYPASEILKAIAKNPHIRLSLTSRGALMIGDYKIDKLNEPLPNIIKNILCFKALAYCCSLDKPCSNRDLALEMLGLSKKTYTELKEDFERRIIGSVYQSPNSEECEPIDEIFYGEREKHDSFEEGDLSVFSKPENPYSSSYNESDKVESETTNFFTELSGGTQFEKQKIIYCKKCGRRINEYSRFCPECGSPIQGT